MVPVVVDASSSSSSTSQPAGPMDPISPYAPPGAVSSVPAASPGFRSAGVARHEALQLTPERLSVVRRTFPLSALEAIGEERSFALVCPLAMRAVEILELFMRPRDDHSFGLIARARKMVVVALREQMAAFAMRTCPVSGGAGGSGDGGGVCSGPMSDEVEVGSVGAVCGGGLSFAGFALCVGDLAVAGLRVAYVMMNGDGTMPHHRLMEAVGLDRETLVRIYNVAGCFVEEVVFQAGISHIDMLVRVECAVVMLMEAFQRHIHYERNVRVHASSLANRFLGVHLNRLFLDSKHPAYMDPLALACAVFWIATKQWEYHVARVGDLSDLTAVPRSSIRAAEWDVLNALGWRVHLGEDQIRTLYEFQPTREVHEYELTGGFKDVRPEDDDDDDEDENDGDGVGA